MKKLCLSIFTMLFSVILYSQDLPRIIPPSPEAASLAKFGEIPVSHYTGLPNINIPFYTIQQDGVTIPISLSYHARGMSVEEIAPRVGMGWALNYGGSMSRQTRGKPDNSQFGFNKIRTLVKSALSYDPTNSNTEESTRRALFNRYIDGYDFLPDKFMFNANSISGNLTINYEDLEPLLKEYDDIKISYSNNNAERIENFKITDSRGNEYYFGKSLDNRTAVNTDETQIAYVYKGLGAGGVNQFGGDTEDPFINSWQLMEIITPNNTSIKFYYELEESVHLRRDYDRYFPSAITYKKDNGLLTTSYAYYPGIVGGNQLISSVPYAGGNGQSSTLESYYSKIRSKQYQLKEIVFDTGKIEFLNINSREDLPSTSDWKTLDEILIKDKNNHLIKKYKLDYHYKEGVADGNELYALISQDATAKKRLFLSSIQEFNPLNESLPPYIFTYNNQQLPNRFSNSQDIWGYYNGKPNGQFLTFFEYGNETNNRTVDPEKSGVGILEKINYPTGGSTEFIFEDNKTQPSIAFSEVVTTNINPFYHKNEGLASLNFNDPIIYNNGVYEKEFEIKILHPDGLNATVNIQTPTGDCSPFANNQTNCNFSITLSPVSGGGMSHQLLNGSNTYPIQLNPGIYVLKVEPQNHIHDPANNFDHHFDVNLTWKEQDEAELTQVYAGGKRIKKIETKDSNGTIISFKEYEYAQDEFGNTTVTSGKLFGLPNFMSVAGALPQNDNITVYMPTGASGGTPVSSMIGNSIGYENVTEYFGDKNNNIGKVEYSYTVTDDSGDYHKYPYNLPTDNSWTRGKPISTKYYSLNSNNQYNLEKKIQNVYFYGGLEHDNLYSSPQVYLNPTSYFRQVNQDIKQESEYFKNRNDFMQPYMALHYILSPADGSPETLNYTVYHLNGGTQDLLKIIETDYNDSGLLEKTTTYNYDYDNHYQLKGSETANSKGDVLKTVNYYPIDKGTLLNLSSEYYDGAAKLEQQNRFEVLQTEVINNDVIQSVLRNNYKRESSTPLLENISIQKGTNGSLEERVIYHNYDSKGNPVEVSKKDGSRVYYVWGYDKTQPIAKIEGYECEIIYQPLKDRYITVCFTDAQLQAVGDAQSVSNYDVDLASEELLRQSLNQLRDSLPDAQVTTFTYDPLIGVTSITDPRGEVIYYEYDGFNRLKHVKDKDGNILSENQYNYKN